MRELKVDRATKAILEKERLIFTATPGRSGTQYLAAICSLLSGVTSCHEPKPRFEWVLHKGQKNRDFLYDFLVYEKLPAISLKSSGVYIETSHVFCKGFFEPLLDLGIQPDLIILTRPHREVATSLYHLDTIPGRRSDVYYLRPDDPGVLDFPGWQNMHDYQLCFWECLEIERRSNLYEKILKERDKLVVRISLKELSTDGGFTRLRNELHLPDFSDIGKEIYSHISGIHFHRRGENRNPPLDDEEKEELEHEVLTKTGGVL